MDDSDRVRITVTVSKAEAAKITELGQRMGASQSRMASMLLEAGLSDHGWIIRFVTSRVVKGITEFLGYDLKNSEDAIAEELELTKEGNDAKGIAEPTMDCAVG